MALLPVCKWKRENPLLRARAVTQNKTRTGRLFSNIVGVAELRWYGQKIYRKATRLKSGIPVEGNWCSIIVWWSLRHQFSLLCLTQPSISTC